MFRKHISALVLLLLFAAAVPAQVHTVADYVKAEMKKQRIPGLSVAIVKDGKVILAEGYGLANIDSNVPAKPETVYRICSVSKQFIATGIMLLAQEGRLAIDDSISKHLEGTPATWQPITIRHLLTHTSGIVPEAPASILSKFRVMPTSLRPPTLGRCDSRRGRSGSIATPVTSRSPKSAKAIFVGRVLAIEETLPIPKILNGEVPEVAYAVKLGIEGSWKGPKTGQVLVWLHRSSLVCSRWQFQPNERYLVYAREFRHVLIVDTWCSRTRPLERNDQRSIREYKELDTLRARNSPL